MVSIKALDTLTPADLWREVPLVEEFWEEAQERQCRVLKVLLEETLEDQQLELLAGLETSGNHESPGRETRGQIATRCLVAAARFELATKGL